MSLLFSSRKACYCAFCKTERKVYLRKNISWLGTFGAVMGALAMTFAVFQEVDPRGIFIFISFLIMGEVFVKIRWRMNIVCGQCGFDPVLYAKDHEAAAEKVKAFLSKRKEDPSMLLKPSLNLPKISKERAVVLREQEVNHKRGTGKIISRQI